MNSIALQRQCNTLRTARLACTWRVAFAIDDFFQGVIGHRKANQLDIIAVNGHGGAAESTEASILCHGVTR